MTCDTARRLRIFAVGFIAVFVLASLPTSAQNNKSDATNVLGPAAKPATKKNARTAAERALRKDLAALHKLLAKDPNDAILLNNIGVAYHKLGENQQALDFVMRSLTIDGTAPKSYMNLGIIFTALGRHEDALAAVARANRMVPDREKPRIFECELLTQLQRDKETVECFEKLIADFGERPWLRIGLGIAMIRDGDAKEATKVLEQAAAELPDNPIAQNALAIALYSRKKFDDAIEHLEECVEKMPDVVALRFNLAMSYWADGQKDEAREEYDAVKQLDPDLAYKLNRLFYSDYLVDASVLAQDN